MVCGQKVRGESTNDALRDGELEEIVLSDLGGFLRIEGLKVVEGAKIVAVPLQDGHRRHDHSPRTATRSRAHVAHHQSHCQ